MNVFCSLIHQPVKVTAQLFIFGEPPTGATPTSAMTTWCQTHHCLPTDVYNLVAGEHVEFNVTASNTLPHRNISLAVLADPGLPSGFHVSAPVVYDLGGDKLKAHMKRFSFTPIPGQEGIVYKVCTKATDLNNATDTVSKCITINVHAPHVAFREGTAHVQERTVGVNCPVLLELFPYDAANQGYCMQVFAGKNAEPKQGALPPGAQLSHVGTQARSKKGTHDGCEYSEWLLAWYPQRGHEPKTYTYCVHARDTLCMGYRCEQRGAELCFTVHVVKCRYCLGSGETIMHAAARYKSDWMQVNTHTRTRARAHTK